MRLMLLHFEHSHDLSLKSAFDKLKNLGMHRIEKVEVNPLALENVVEEQPDFPNMMKDQPAIDTKVVDN